jgi:hypothetical protein
MTLKQSWVSRAARALKLGTAGIALLATAGGLTAGCLDRPVVPAVPNTSNVVVKTVTQSGVDKIDLLFMIDNSISMADKQRILAEAVPVLVQRLIDPICVDADGNPAGGTNMNGCAPNTPEFSPIEDIHIGVITSSLGNHGGEVCTDDETVMPPRTLNDSAQLIASVRQNVYSYASQGFLVWDPRTGDDRPNPETHPNLTMRETNATAFVEDFAAHVQATGERGCGYEASLEAWYRFLIDPEPINQVTLDPTGQFSVRGPINPIVLQQRAAFMRPDSLLAIIMLTDENDCSIDDEEGHQGWLVGRRAPMPRGSDACSHPEDPNLYRCCVPCVLVGDPNFQPAAGCNYNGDVACGMGTSLMPIEDSTNLRCYQQVRRFGLNLLYPWDRYSNALKAPRIGLRAPDMNGNTEVTNPLYTPGADGTPAREPGLVFLAGIVGVPWQDIATGDSLMAPRALTYLTATEMRSPPMGTPPGDRWDVILGDPDTGRLPSDPFMHETIDPRSGTNPITGDAIQPPGAGSNGNDINGSEQNIVNRDDLQYACIFDLEPDVPCDMSNTDGCDCNDSEQPYQRPLCTYNGTMGTQTHAKAYPGVRHLQVLKGFGDNAIVASICPKNVDAQGGSAASDANYGYNPAVGAIINRLKEALVATCLPRPLAPEENEEVPCTVVEALIPPPGGMCGVCGEDGRRPLEGATANVEDAVFEELEAKGLCGEGTGVNCAEYCMCEIIQFTGQELANCQGQVIDSDTQSGYCYVDAQSPAGPELLKDCPDTQQQIIRFMGEDTPKAGAIGFIACLGGSVTAGATDTGM